MLALALASLLAAPPAGEGMTVTLRPAVVVTAEEPTATDEGAESSGEPEAKASAAPRLAPAKAQPSKARPRRARSTASPEKKGR